MATMQKIVTFMYYLTILLNIMNTVNYWQGLGRKLIRVPAEVRRSRISNNQLLNQLYITDLGFYPTAQSHYTLRPKGCPESIIIICAKGKGSYETQDGHYQVQPGQFFLLPPGQRHQYAADVDEPWSIYWIRFTGKNSLAFNAQNAVKKCYKPMYLKDLPGIEDLFTKIYGALENGYSQHLLSYANMVFQHLLGELIYRVQDNKKTTNNMVDDVILFMRNHITQQLSLEELAVQFKYSPSRFSNIFKTATGYSPMAYFIQLKIQQSCQLLELTNLKIYAIAQQCGYEDPFHFSKLFKKIMHLSPEQYRSVQKG